MIFENHIEFSKISLQINKIDESLVAFEAAGTSIANEKARKKKALDLKVSTP